MPIQIVNIGFNFDTPAPPTGHSNIVFQDDGGTPQVKVSAFDPLMVGDAGSGGLSGNVPAPGTGDAAAGKYLDASGAWSAPPVPSPAASGWQSGSNANGYWVKDPLGHYHMWGTVSGLPDTTAVTGNPFPTSFTSFASIRMTSIDVGNLGGNIRPTCAIPTSISQFSCSATGSGATLSWMADGY